MSYLAVIGVDKNSGLLHTVIVDDATYTVTGDFGFVSPDAVSSRLRMGGDLLPLNFSVDKAGKILQNCGDFSRFSPRGSAVVVAEIKTRGGRPLGYRLLSCATKACVNLRLEEILQREAAMGNGEHFLQNGIIRNKTVNCYPMHPFPVMTVDGPRRKAATPMSMVAPTGHKDKKEAASSKAVTRSDFTDAQLKEISSCQNAGFDARFIANPKLSPSQMRVLWVAKTKGCMSESFADPRYSAEVMKFYADRLYDQQTVADCAELLAHPELGVDELSELYACVCQGVPYSDLIGLSATDIDVKRTMAAQEYWGTPDAFDAPGSSEFGVDERALQAARRVRGV